MNRGKYAPRDWHALAVLAAAIAVFFRDILLQRAFLWEDFIKQVYPFRTFAAASLARGELPLWNPHAFSGMPFQADIQSAVFYLPNLFLTPFVSGGFLSFYALEVSLIAHYVFAGATMYYLAKEFGLEGRYALFSALVFALSGFMIVHAIHLAFIQEVAWFPLVTLLLHRAIVRGSMKYAVGAGLVAGHMFLAGAPQMSFYLFLLVVGYSLGFRHSRAPERSRGESGNPVPLLERLRYAMPAGLIALGVAAIQLLPTLELIPLSERATLSAEQARFGQLAPEQLITVILPKYFGAITAKQSSYVGPGMWATYIETCVYWGIPALLAALATLPVLRRERALIVWWLVVAASLLLAMTGSAIPGFAIFRAPARVMVLATFAIALLAGFGLRSLTDRLASTRVAILPRWGLPLVMAVLQFVDMSIFGFDQNNGPRDADTYFHRSTSIQQPIVDQLRDDGQREIFRAKSRQDTAALLDRNQGMVDGVYLTEGYSALALSRVLPPARDSATTFDLLNVKYRVFVDAPRRVVGMGVARTYLPRAFVVHEARVLNNDSALRDFMRSDAFDPRRMVALETDPVLDTTTAVVMPAASATIASYRATRIDIDVTMPRSGVLVLSEIFYPGWKATIDGRHTRVLRANWSLRAVVVPAGTHRVTMRFQPMSFWWGVVMATLTIVASIVFLSRRPTR